MYGYVCVHVHVRVCVCLCTYNHNYFIEVYCSNYVARHKTAKLSA